MIDPGTLPRVDLADLNGSVKFSFVGGSYDIRFSYAVLAKMQAMYGEGFLDKMEDATGKKKISALCEVLAIATGHEKTKIMEDSVPILPAIQALNMAWQAAWFGGQLEVPGTDEDEDTEEAEPKKLKPRATLWQRLASWLCGRGWTSRPSTA